MHWGDFTKGLIIGATAGVLAGVLFAPKSGRETRQDIKNYLTEIKDSIAAKLADIKDLTQERYNAVVDAVVDSYQDAKKITGRDAREIRRDLKENYEKVRGAMDRW